MRPSSFASSIVTLGVLAGSLTGCAQVLGLGDYKDEASGGSGGSTSSSTGSTSSASTSTGSSSSGGSCTPSSTMACFDGMLPAKAGTGICVAGTQTCNTDGMGYGACMGQTLPKPETCADTHDEDCDGKECGLWAKLYGDMADQTVSGVVVDSVGNIVVAGTFAGTLAFDPANPLSANGTQIYLAKFDPNGIPLFSKVFPSGGAVSVSGIAIGPNDAVYMTGTFDNNANVNFGTGALSTIDFLAGYVVKFNPMGATQWSQALDLDDVTNVTPPAVDSSGSVVLFGYQECGFSCQSHTNNLWLEKRAQNGSMQWHKSFFLAPGTGSRGAGGVAVDPFDNIVIAGGFGGTENLGGGAFTSLGLFDGLVARFDTNGAFLTKIAFGDAAGQFAADVGTDSSGDVFVVGNFAGTITYAGTQTITSAGGTDWFVGRIDAGSPNFFKWMKRYGDAADQAPTSIAVTKLGAAQLLVTGGSQGGLDFGNGPLTNHGGVDLPIVKLDGNGNAIWSRLYGDTLNQVGSDIAFTANGKSVVVGNVATGIDVGTGPLTSAGKLDVLLATFAP